MRRLTERPAELPAEMRRRQPRRIRKRRNIKRVTEPRIGEVLRTQQMPGRRDGRHANQYAEPTDADTSPKPAAQRGGT